MAEQKIKERHPIVKEAEQIKQPVSDEALSRFNEDQLWAIYMALDRSNKVLADVLTEADKSLAKQFYDYGKREYRWV